MLYSLLIRFKCYLQSHIESITIDGLKNLPICQSVCDDWWDACKDEYTCTDNWLYGFDHSHPGETRVNCWLGYELTIARTKCYKVVKACKICKQLLDIIVMK